MKTRWLSIVAVVMSCAASAPAQSPCYDFGSQPVAASWDASALPLGCTYAPNWPQWHLFTPGHRMPAPHVGFNPGDAWPLPRVIVTYRCTGLLFVPVVVDRVRFAGYVVDQPEYACQ